jgi:hypothetical protein
MLKRKYDEMGIPFVLRHIGDPLRSGEIASFLLDTLG